MAPAQENWEALCIHRLAQLIALQRSPESTMAVAATPLEIARALFLEGWEPPKELSRFLPLIPTSEGRPWR